MKSRFQARGMNIRGGLGPKRQKVAEKFSRTLSCLECSNSFAVHIPDLRENYAANWSQGPNTVFEAQCPECEEWLEAGNIPRWARRLIRRHYGRICGNCKMPIDQHVSGKCILDSTSYAPGMLSEPAEPAYRGVADHFHSPNTRTGRISSNQPAYGQPPRHDAWIRQPAKQLIPRPT
jgi:hypothetical protein